MNFRYNIIPIALGLAIGFLTFYPFTYSSSIALFFVGIEEISHPDSKAPWRTAFDQSTDQQNIWIRSYMAFNGLLNSIRPEVIYLQTMWDADGDNLRGKSNYVIEGISPKCRYWSIAIYQGNKMIKPIENSIKNNFNTVINEDGTYKIFLSNDSNYQNHINHQGNDFSVVMRIYGPDIAYYENTTSLPVGLIKKQIN